jgi:ABC-type amino acid transport system permease subunit
VLVLSLVGSLALYNPSSFLNPVSLEEANVQGKVGGVETTYTEDLSSTQWLQSLHTSPALALTKGMAHTLFGPYPWVPFTHGLTYNSTELFYPGTVMGIIGLPFFFIALWRLLVRGYSELIRGSPELLVILSWAFLIVLEYMAYLGEFSSRQRVILIPLFWILVAFGVEQVRARFNKPKAAR